MKKEEIRKEFFKLRIKHHSYNQCRKILIARFDYAVTIRTLQRWSRKLDQGNWDLADTSTRPNTIHSKITTEIESKILDIRKELGWGQEKISGLVDVSHWTVNKVLNKHKLCNPNPHRKKRIKYIRWQRKHPNSLWQMDISDQKVKDKYCFAVIDDCSRFCLGLFALNRISTEIITKLLDNLIKIYGIPREILTDNGSVFGLKSKHSKFDKWCRRRGIKHIRTAIHSPTTTGKVERFFQTLSNELKFCRNAEHFRMRYNHFRPHTSLYKKTPSLIYFGG